MFSEGAIKISKILSEKTFFLWKKKITGEWSVEIGVSIFVIVTNPWKFFKKTCSFEWMKPALNETWRMFCVKLNRLDFVFVTIYILHKS